LSGDRGKARISARDWETLYRRYFPKLGSYFASRGLNPTEAEDLAHDVFRELGQAKVPENAKAYIYAIARNLFAQRRRRELAEQDTLAEYLRHAASVHVEAQWRDATTDPPTEDSREQVERLLGMLADRLSPEDMELVTLRFLEELTTEEVAQRLRCSEEALRKRLERIRAALRPLLREMRRKL
jgi:RNA polymerase sigma-70 factor, ECF subfamily